MKHTALRKDVTREIKKSFGRFISIFAIVAIGVAFFAGVKASVPVMKASADQYYDDYNLMDIKVMTSIGLTKDDMEAIQKVDGIKGAYGSFSLDALTMVGNDQHVIKVLSFPVNMKEDDPNYLNQPQLVEGRLPEKLNECVIESDKLSTSGLSIGDTIPLTSGSDVALNASLKNTEYTIVGVVHSPLYISYEKGSAAIGSGKINQYILIPDGNFTSSYYTEAYVSVEGANKENSYDDAYFDIIEHVKTDIAVIGEERADLRFGEIKKEGLDKIAQGRIAYDENKKRYDEEIKTAEDKLSAAHDQTLIGQASLNANKTTAQQTLLEKEAQMKQIEQVLVTLQDQYNGIKGKVETDKKQFDDTKPYLQGQIDEAKQKIMLIDDQIREVDEKLKNPALSDIKKVLLEDQKKALILAKSISEPSITMLEQQLKAMQSMLDAGFQQLSAIQSQMDVAKQQLETGKKQLADANVSTNKQMQQAQEKIDQAHTQLIQGQLELDKQTKDGAAKLSEAKEKLDKSEEEVKAMQTPAWFVLDRHAHYSYMEYGAAADRMGGIAKVFPLFFFLVAALVCLTTMTRMVDEQRNEIGTLKALGYTKGHIAIKYIAYAGIASVLGGIFGAIAGMSLFPTVIFNAWNIIYTLPQVHLVMDVALALLAISLVTGITILAALAALYKELMDVPSQLMRPKAPMNGKKIMLERMPFIWKRFSFIYKVTARNIFRYKKRFLMTVIGISGCTALLLAGFGIQDSIRDIPALQYGSIYKYDVSMRIDTSATSSQREALLTQLKEHTTMEEAMGAGVYNGFYEDQKEDKGITIFVPMDIKQFPDFVDLHTRRGKEALNLTNDGAIITEKVAQQLNIKIGDMMNIDNGEGSKKEVKITGICENYIGHALYMSSSYYKSVFHTSAKETELYGIMNTSDSESESSLGNGFMNDKAITSISFYSSIADNFQKTIASLSFVVIVLIMSAGLLAFVVLYNLTNVNISERIREIATIKVLGFYNREVSSYVYRENIFLTLIGSLVGLILGIFLHALIMQLAEMDTIMFGRNIYWYSYIFSVLITMGFSLFVNLVMYRKLKHVPMVESLKSVE